MLSRMISKWRESFASREEVATVAAFGAKTGASRGLEVQEIVKSPHTANKLATAIVNSALVLIELKRVLTKKTFPKTST